MKKTCEKDRLAERCGPRPASCRRGRLVALAFSILTMLTAPAPGRAQTLNLGDPRPPAAQEMIAGREKAQELREQANRLRAEVGVGDGSDQTLRLAQAQWRDLAAWLLDQPDPLAQPRIVLLGWSLAQRGEDFDRAMGQLVRGEELSAAQRDESLSELRRFAAVALPLPGGRAGPQEPPIPVSSAMAQIRAASRPLVEAFSVGTEAAAASSETLFARLARNRMLIADDPDLAPLAAALARCEELGGHAGWRTEAEWALRHHLDFIEGVRHLDDAAWLGTAWRQHRAAAVAEAIQGTTEPGGEQGNLAAQRVCRMAACVAKCNDLALLAPATRPRLDLFRDTVGRWMHAALLGEQVPPWRLLSEAFESMRRRRADQSAPAQRELRMACSALDDESDTLERMMAQWLERAEQESQRSDPEWVTVIGRHREIMLERQSLLDLPAGIDLLATFDPRASAIIWKRLLPEARAVDDPIVRQTLLAATHAIAEFKATHSDLPLEGDWVSGADWLDPLVGNQRAGVLARLDVLRRMRAAELIAGQPLPATVAELDAMRDLFRLVAIWRELQSPALYDEATLGLPLGLARQETQRLEAALRRALDQGAGGGAPFTREVAWARQEAAGGIIVASVATPDGDGRSGQLMAALGPLLAIADSCEWGSEPGDAGGERLAQWCVLQFEVAQRNTPDSGTITPYLRFLGGRMAEALWRQSR